MADAGVSAGIVADLLLREWLWLTALLIFVSSLDDLAVDAAWIVGVMRRRDAPAPPPADAPALRHAVLIPAWREADVIGPMLRRLCATLDHPDWRAFVGVYPNDAATRAAVLAVGDPRVSLVTVRRPGPTTKADCLNHLWRAALNAEGARPFDAFVLHDAEDVVHARELRLFDRHLTHAAMVQLPVLPLPDDDSPWIAGHYLDEFAEAHAKEMVVRGLLGCAIPSAGVATAIRRDAMMALAREHGVPFDVGSLTEDYALGQRLHRMGLPARFVRQRVGGGLVQTREFFPDTVAAAVRQKRRWLLGIALDGWDRIGWRGGWRDRWMLARDRKGLATALLSASGYLLAAALALRLLAGEPTLPGGAAQPLLAWLLVANAALLAWRLLLRAAFAWRAAGWREGLSAVPRAVVGNGINALAAFAAVRGYRKALRDGAPLPWDKTEHRFPA